MRQGSISTRFIRDIVKWLRKSKHGGDVISNFRPFTMLNTDSNIMAKILAGRLQTVLPCLVCPEQSCAVKGGTIQDSLHRVRTIVEKVDGNAALINLDQSKTEPFLLTHLIRQGCPLSPMLYILALEPFLGKLKASPALRSLTLPGSCEVARYTAYADDVSVLVTSSADVDEKSKEIERYVVVIGAKINREKSVDLRLGS